VRLEHFKDIVLDCHYSCQQGCAQHVSAMVSTHRRLLYVSIFRSRDAGNIEGVHWSLLHSCTSWAIVKSTRLLRASP